MNALALKPAAESAPILEGQELEARRKGAREVILPFSNEYPFESRFARVPGGVMHYLDEGPRDGKPILFVHGNPTWSFYYRGLVKAFRSEYRCIAPDHIGCGLSDKPQAWSYRLEDHIANLEALILALDLRDITLCVHDWGGPIGFGFAHRHRERIKRIVITNTAAFRSLRIPLRIALCKTPGVGSFLVRRFNAFAELATKMAVHDKERMNPVVRRGYLAPYDSYATRIATHQFVKDIPLRESHPSYRTLVEVEESLAQFATLPTCIVWGERDFCFTPHFRDQWIERFPNARVLSMDDAGHYVLEDAHKRATQWLGEFFRENPLP